MFGVGDDVVEGITSISASSAVASRLRAATAAGAVFTERLEDNFMRVDGALAELLGDDEAVRLVADHQRRVKARRPLGRRFLDHRGGAQGGRIASDSRRATAEPAARPTKE